MPGDTLVRTRGGAVRCAAGTRTARHVLSDPTLVLRGLLRRPFGDPSLDLPALVAGTQVAVSALRSRGRRARHGLLVLRPGGAGLEVSWHPYRWLRGFGAPEVDRLPVRLPADPPAVRWRRLPRAFQPVSLLVGEEQWHVAVPKADAALLRDAAPRQAAS